MSKTPGRIDYPAPFLGENNLDVLADFLGYSEDDVAKLTGEGIL